MTKVQRTFIRYSISFKQNIVREIEETGKGISEIQQLYGINGADTIQRWLKKYGKHYLLNKVIRVEVKGERDRIKDLEAEIKRLKITLADVVMQKDALENLIDIVDEHYQTDVKKNLGQQQFVMPIKSKGTA